MDQDVYEREIDLKDLFFTLLYQWRKIVGITVVCAALIAGFLCYRGMKGAGDVSVADSLDSMEDYEKMEQMLVGNIDRVTTSLEQQNTYLDNADIMQIDPYHKPEASAEVLLAVKGEKGSYFLNALLQMYNYSLKQGEYLEGLAKGQHTQLNYLKEQIDINTENFSASDISALGQLDVEIEEGESKLGMLHIKVTASTLEKAGEIRAEVLKQLGQVQKEVAEEYGEHTYKVLQKSSAEVVDTDLWSRQQKVINDISALNTSYQNYKTQLGNLEEPDADAGNADAGHLSKKDLLKYLILGILGGGVIAVFCLGAVYVFRDTVISEEQVRQYFGVRGLGTFHRQPNNRAFGFIDRFINRWEKGTTVLSEDEIYDMVATNLGSYAGDERNILLSGMADQKKLERVGQRLRKLLPEYSFEIAENVVYHAMARKKLVGHHAVVLVEEVHGTKCHDLQQEIDVARNLQAEVLGCILV